MTRHPDALLFARNAARVTTQHVLHPSEKAAAVAAAPVWKRHKVRDELAREWAATEARAAAEAAAIVGDLRQSFDALEDALDALARTKQPELLGPVDLELQRIRTANAHLDAARTAIESGDFGAAGAAVEEARREVAYGGGKLVVAVNRALSQAAVGKAHRAHLDENLAERRQARLQLDNARAADIATTVAAECRCRLLDAAGYGLAAEILGSQVRRDKRATTVEKVGRDNTMRVLAPHECETFADVGGLEEVKAQLRDTVGAILERPDEAARYHVLHNGILFYGPPGTGKNLLSRALAGEYGMRYLRFSPATIASAYIHEAAANLRKVFELAVDSAPCVLYLDEIDTIASDRSEQPSADHREVVTQLMICLEEYRAVPGLVIVAGTNELDRLDPALREGRFDAKVLIPLPDAEAREDVLRVHLQRRGDAVAWDALDLAEAARLTTGYNAAALETVVSLAAQQAMRTGAPIDGEVLATVIRERGGQHRISLDNAITWDDVVLDQDTRAEVMQVLAVFAKPDVARKLGVQAPAGILLYGPPGTGKTTIARAMASQMSASFYEMSAADLLSKWAGESEQRVAKLFAKARANRPSVIFIDEIDALLRRRSADTNAKWEERVLSQFLRELDGLKGGDGVLLVGATNRLDTIDEAIVGRRLSPIEVGLPDAAARLRLLDLLCAEMNLGKNVNLRTLAGATEGASGADLKNLRDKAGMRALSRVFADGDDSDDVEVTMDDFEAALRADRNRATFAPV